MIGLIILAISMLCTIAWIWSGGIEYMKKNHPNYKGDDFLMTDKEVHNKAGRDGWDDNLYEEIF